MKSAGFPVIGAKVAYNVSVSAETVSKFSATLKRRFAVFAMPAPMTAVPSRLMIPFVVTQTMFSSALLLGSVKYQNDEVLS